MIIPCSLGVSIVVGVTESGNKNDIQVISNIHDLSNHTVIC